jgi:hypothetical protein
MEIIRLIIQILATVLGVRLHWPTPILWILKLFVSALSPLLFLIGVLSAIVGLTTGSVFITLIGINERRTQDTKSGSGQRSITFSQES